MGVEIEFCGAVTTVADDAVIVIGREADISVDDNPFLHRHFLRVAQQGPFWFLSNIGSQLNATVADRDGQMEAFLAPGASIPLVFKDTVVSFTAGPTTYELAIRIESPAFTAPPTRPAERGDTTIGPTRLTADQHLLILALAEPRLRGDGRASVVLPSSNAAAQRLGWTITKFNRKLDNVCSKLSKLGVRGVYGGPADLASNRRARLVEYAVATRLVTRDDIPLLDSHRPATSTLDDD